MAALPEDPDPCVVETAPLARILNDFAETYRRQYPSTVGQFRSEERGADEVEMPAAFVYVAEHTARRNRYGDLIEGPAMTPKEVRRLALTKQRLTELRVADRVLCAIGNPTAAFHGADPPLRVMPNPQASPKAQRGCCGGSVERGGMTATMLAAFTCRARSV